jgi:type I restriction enzyme R subunit
MLPESRARKNIDLQLASADWIVQDREDINLGAGLGVAVREFSVTTGATDYLLYVDRRACGVLEAKPEGVTLTGFEEQSAKYLGALKSDIPSWGASLLLEYESTGTETRFTDHRDPAGSEVDPGNWTGC